MNETRSVKKTFEGKLEGRKRRGRPRLKWINDVEDDLRKLGVKRWRTKALDREEWASIIREDKAKLKGPYRYWKKKKITKLTQFSAQKQHTCSIILIYRDNNALKHT